MAIQPSETYKMTARPRGRQPTFDRNRALETALELFWRYGYEGVSVADLTAAIGIAAPSLYHAFGRKADLYREVLRRYALSSMSSDDIEAAPTGYDAACQMLQRGVAAVTTPGKPLGCMISSGLLVTSSENAGLAAELRQIRASTREALQRRFAQDVAEGSLPATTDVPGLARYFTTVLQGLSVQALDGATRTELLAVAASALRTWPTAER